MFVAGGFERVYEVGSVFRAENSNTNRHLTEFTGIDFEMGFIEDENDIMDVCEQLFQKLVFELNAEFKLGVALPTQIPRIPMSELKKMLRDKGKNSF